MNEAPIILLFGTKKQRRTGRSSTYPERFQNGVPLKVKPKKFYEIKTAGKLHPAFQKTYDSCGIILLQPVRA